MQSFGSKNVIALYIVMAQPSFLSHNNMKAAATHYYWFYHQTQSDVKNGKLQLWSSLAHSIFVPDEMIFINMEVSINFAKL